MPRLISAELWLFFLYADYNAAMVVALTEIMPPAVRATGFSMAYSLATAIFGGFTPAIASVLINESGIMHCLVIAGSVIRVDGRVAFAKILSGRRPQRGLLITRDEDPASEVIYT